MSFWSRPVLEIVTIVLTFVVAIILVGSVIGLFVMKAITPSVDIGAVVLVISEILATIVGFLIGQAVRSSSSS